MNHPHDCPRCGSIWFSSGLPSRWKNEPCYECLRAERDRLLAIMETIVHNHDCDPRAEAREALEGKP